MNASLIADFEDRNGALAKILKDLSGETPYYYINAGNGGDCLIAAATYQLFNHYGIRFIPAAAPGQIKDSTVILSGGGNLVPLYGGMAAVIKLLKGRNNRLIILPHSIRGLEPLLASFEPSTIVFCREPTSYEHVRKHAPQCTTYISHDLALFLDTELINACVPHETAAHKFEEALARAKIGGDWIRSRRLSCMRHGVEKTFLPKGPNFDISILFQVGTMPGNAELGAWMMLEFCRRAAHITTNRLHVGIAGGLVGTPITLLDNNYGKISAVYAHSMQGRFGSITFVDAPTVEAPPSEERLSISRPL